MKKNNGITLIALVVTIVVLIILAGVTDIRTQLVSGQQKDVLKPSKMRCNIKTSKF